MNYVNQIQFQPDQAIQWGISILGSGAGNMMSTTMSAVSSIVSGLATFFIAFSFACYILFQKEQLHIQIRKVCFCVSFKTETNALLKICSLIYRTFANFLTGQCLGGCNSRKHVCRHVKHFENALCTANRNPDRLYGIDPQSLARLSDAHWAVF